jgi:hypothetical protein
MGYVEIPVQVIPYPSLAPSPLSHAGAELARGANSLVQYNSITVTAQSQPSDIAKRAVLDLFSDDRELKNCLDFVNYLDICEQKGFRIKGFDTKKGVIVSYPLSYNNRWGPVRRRELAAKLDRLSGWFEMQEDRPVTLVTLTSYQKGLSIASAWFELNKSRDKLRKLIHKYFGNVDYFWVVEPHKSGYVHYHMAVFANIDNSTKDKQGRGVEDKFRDYWTNKYKTGNHTYGLDFSQKKDDDKIKDLKKYLQKYLSKGFLLDKWTRGMLKFNAAMHDTGFRMYGASKNIREIMNCSQEKQLQVVWLETKMQYPESVNGEVLELEKVIWYRQYIPDWIDSDLWIWDGKVRQDDPPPIYIYTWGRGPWPSEYVPMEVRVISYKDLDYKRVRSRDDNPYDDWRPASHQNVTGVTASSRFMRENSEKWRT